MVRSMDMRPGHCLFAVLLAACGNDENTLPQSFAGLSRVSAASSFGGCTAGGSGTNYLNAEVEPRLSIDPTDPRHMVGVWQQDRWSNGGAHGLVTGVTFDSGVTWERVTLPYTVCSGGTFERASDPWVSFAPDGTVHQIGYGFNATNDATAMLASRSADGGRTWSPPITLFGENTLNVAIDKETITADPDGQTVYAIWDRVSNPSSAAATDGSGPAWFTRSTNAGVSWEPARIVYDPGLNNQTISNQIAVLPSGMLLDLLVIILNTNPGDNAVSSVNVLRSADKSMTSPQLVPIATMEDVGAVDPKNPSVFIRTGDIVPDIAVDSASGAVYVVWEDGRFSATHLDGIAISRSTDGGVTWSTPARVNGVTTAQAFTPAIAIGQGGVVGVTYYDLRNDNPSDGSHLLATRWLATSHDGGNTFTDTAMSGPFDIRNAPQVVAENGLAHGYFLGDYEGLVAVGGSFLPFFVITNNGDTNNRTDVFARPVSPSAAARPFSAALAAPPRIRSGPRRVF